MDKNALWIVCEHIYIGSAEEIHLRPNNRVTCNLCAVTPTNAKRVRALFESHLREIIKDIDIVVGMKYLDEKE